MTRQQVNMYRILSVLLFLSAWLLPCAMAETVTVGGTGSGLGVMRLLGSGFSQLTPRYSVKVLPSLGTSGGIRALRAGALDMAIASRKVTNKEREGLEVYSLGRSPFVFAVHPGVPMDNITLAQVRDIYAGDMAVWSDGNPIRWILRPVDESDWLLMRAISTEMAGAVDLAQKTEGLFVAITDIDVADSLEKIKGSFSPIPLTLIVSEKRLVKVLSLNGVQPSVEALAAHHYPLAKPYYLLVRQDAPESVRKFIAFIRSHQGQQLLYQSGIDTNLSPLF